MSSNIKDKLLRIQYLQDYIIEQADKHDAYVTKQYFGIERRVVNESHFTAEIAELKKILISIEFSPALCDQFNQARERLVCIINQNDSDLVNPVRVFEDLDLQQKLKLACDIARTFHELFFDFDYKYALPTIEFDPKAFTSLHRSFGLDDNSDYPISSRIRFSKNILGPDAQTHGFLNLVFHEACVHAPLYQLQQGFYYGHLPKDNKLYNDAHLIHTYTSMGISPKFFISSIYPNFLEEKIAFFQSALFVKALGLRTLGPEDDIILKSKNKNWPYNPPKPF
jgi:hypothetical protein